MATPLNDRSRAGQRTGARAAASPRVRVPGAESKEAARYNLNEADKKIKQRKFNAQQPKPTVKPTVKPTASATGRTPPPKPAATPKTPPPPRTPTAGVGQKMKGGNVVNKSKLGPGLVTRALPAALVAGYAGEELKNTPEAMSLQSALGNATSDVLSGQGYQSNDQLGFALTNGTPEQVKAAQAEIARRRDDPSFFEAGGSFGRFIDRNFGTRNDETSFNDGAISAIGEGFNALIGAVDPATGEQEAPPSALSDAQTGMMSGEYPYIQGDLDTQFGPSLGYGKKPPPLGNAQQGDARLGRAEGENMLQSQNGFMQIPPNDPNGSALAGRVSGGEQGDAAYALEQGALANAIRQRSIDENLGTTAIVGGDTGPSLQDINQQIFDNALDIQNSNPNDADRRNRLQLANESLTAQARSMTNAEGYASNALSDAYSTDMRYQQSAMRDANNLRQDEASLALRQETENRMRQQMLDGREASVADIIKLAEFGNVDNELLESIYRTTTNDTVASILEGMLNRDPNASNYEGGLIEEYAGGGMVPPNVGGQGMPPPQGMSAMRGQPAAMPSQADIANYQQYASKAQQMGLNSIGFEEYLSMKGPTENFAEGGMVPSAPDAAGKMLVDPNPQAGIDSIPAVIDGNRPAKMNSGEFVIPTDVVLFYGTDKLTKMIEKARVTGEPENANSAIGGATGA